MLQFTSIVGQVVAYVLPLRQNVTYWHSDIWPEWHFSHVTAVTIFLGKCYNLPQHHLIHNISGCTNIFPVFRYSNQLITVFGDSP